MHHLAEEDFILHYYGEPEVPGAAAHLASCEECRGRYKTLQLVLNSVDSVPVPERGPDYSAEVWNRLAPHVRRTRWTWWSAPRQWGALAAAAALLVAAFLAGRVSSPKPEPASLASTAVRERILVVAVGDHLERTQLVLAELVNSNPAQQVNISAEREIAEALLSENRLYRQTAAVSGDSGVATVLEDLERVLLDIAHSPDAISGEQLETIRGRIESQGLLFKVRVIGSQLRQQETQPLPSNETKL